MIKIGSDFSGVGAFNQALIRLGIEYDELFACDMDKYARQTFALNYLSESAAVFEKIASMSSIDRGDYVENFYFPKDVYERKIPKESLDIYMTSPPCQAFSLAGKRLGKDDKRGILFFNSLEFIQINKPRYFIFENVKGLLSHDKQDKNALYGRTFQEWINYLGGKSVNGVHTFFPYEDAVPYHIYFQVLNAKHYGIPQNRERIFIIGIRDDEDNNFQFPKPIPLTKRLKDVLESEVDEKYFLSDNAIVRLTNDNTGYHSEVNEELELASTVCASDYKIARGMNMINHLQISNLKSTEAPIVEIQLKGGKWDKTHEQSGRVYDKNGIAPTIHTMGGGNQEPKILANFGNKRLNETLNNNEVPEQDCIIDSYNKSFHTEVSPSILTTVSSANMHHVKIGAIRGRNPDNPKSRQSGLETEQMLEINENGTSNALTTVQKDNVVIISTNNSKGFDEAEEEEDSINFSVPSSTTRRGRVGKKVSQTLDTQCNQGIATKQLSKQEAEWIKGGLQENQPKQTDGISPCLTSAMGMGGGHTPVHNYQQRIRRLTPLECFRLMDFNENFKWDVSDSQAYKQAGNSICVGVLAAIIKNLKL